MTMGYFIGLSMNRAVHQAATSFPLGKVVTLM